MWITITKNDALRKVNLERIFLFFKIGDAELKEAKLSSTYHESLHVEQTKTEQLVIVSRFIDLIQHCRFRILPLPQRMM